MERISRFRSRILLVIFLVIVGLLALKLYDVQIIEPDGNTDNTTTFTTLVRVKAVRGDILDLNGNVMVGNKASYDLTLNHYVVLSTNGTNENLYKLVKTCQEQGIEYNETFPVSKERPFTYTLDEYSTTRQGYFQAFLDYCDGIDSDITAPLLIEKLRDYYSLPEEWTDDEARLVLGLRYEMSLRYCVYSLSQYIFIDDATDEELSAINELNIPGMGVESSTVREYNTKYAAHILGYVGAMSPEQWAYYKTIDGYDMDAHVGQTGLEAVYEEFLHGQDGWREDTHTADGTLVSSVYIQEPKAGSNVEVSIDLNLQTVAENSLASIIQTMQAQPTEGLDYIPAGQDSEGGAVVALDVKTGQVLVCASYPTYDLSTFFDHYNELMEAEHNPLLNRALQGTYPPGSTYKMCTLVAAMETNKVGATEEIYDSGQYTKYKPLVLNCLHYTNTGGGHGNLAAKDAIKVSCNYYFYELGDRLTLTALDSTAKHLGLGEDTGVELYEYVGYRANKETKEKLYAKDNNGWYPADQVLSAIGQSDNRFTPMQLAVYVSTLAKQGVRNRATFMNRVVSADYQQLLAENKPEVLDQMDISDLTYQTYLAGMIAVNHEVGGSCYSTFYNYPVTIAGKTGTAQEHYGHSDNGAYVCFAPADDPQIAIAVYVEKGAHGTTMAKVAKEILDVYFDVDEVSDVVTYENRVS